MMLAQGSGRLLPSLCWERSRQKISQREKREEGPWGVWTLPGSAPSKLWQSWRAELTVRPLVRDDRIP